MITPALSPGLITDLPEVDTSSPVKSVESLSRLLYALKGGSASEPLYNELLYGLSVGLRRVTVHVQ